MANGQPAFAVYERERDGTYGAHAVMVLTVSVAGIARIVTFRNPALFESFGLPREYRAAAAEPAPAQDPAVTHTGPDPVARPRGQKALKITAGPAAIPGNPAGLYQ
jgi:hypothetical protein